MRAFMLLMFVAAVLVLAAPRPLFAHAEVVSSTPEAGSTVDSAPAAVTAVFSQQLAPDESSITVEDSSGARVDADDAAVDASDAEGKTMTVSLKPGLAAGTYTVRWSSLSAEDGETAEGRFTFTVSGSAASPAPSASASASARPSATASATASAAASASAQPSAAGGTSGDQATTLPETGASGLPTSVVIVAAVALVLGAVIRWRRRAQ